MTQNPKKPLHSNCSSQTGVNNGSLEQKNLMISLFILITRLFNIPYLQLNLSQVNKKHHLDLSSSIRAVQKYVPLLNTSTSFICLPFFIIYFFPLKEKIEGISITVQLNNIEFCAPHPQLFFFFFLRFDLVATW